MLVVEISLLVVLCNLQLQFVSGKTMSKNGRKFRVEVAVPPIVTHGEGPHYRLEENALYYVDTFSPEIIRWDFTRETAHRIKLGGRSVGMVIPIKGNANHFIVGADRDLNVLNWDGKSEDFHLKKLSQVDVNKPKNQFNDGKADKIGNLWLGTLTRNMDNTVEDRGGNFYHFQGGDLENPDIKIPHTSISNGVAFGGGGENLYYIDSTEKTVVGFKVDLNTGAISDRKVIFDMANYPELGGIPDGMTIDSDDFLYVALFGGGMVLKLDTRPEITERLVLKIPIPVTYITSVTFGGKNYSTLFATTSRVHVKEGEEPEAGSVYAIHDLGSRGLKPDEAKIGKKYLSK